MLKKLIIFSFYIDDWNILCKMDRTMQLKRFKVSNYKSMICHISIRLVSIVMDII